jgi:hypothetical protein
MLSFSVPLPTAAALAVLSVFVPTVSMAGDGKHRPSLADIHRLEEDVTLPDGADALQSYVRYYYMTDNPRTVVGIYVARYELKYELEPSQIPLEGIILVDGDSDVPRPWDAGCGVVKVYYPLVAPTHIAAECVSSLNDMYSPSGTSRLAFVAICLPIGVFLAAAAWFARRLLGRWIRSSRGNAA